MKLSPSANKAFKIIGGVLILVGLFSLGMSTRDMYVHAVQKMPPEAVTVSDRLINFLGLVPPLIVGWYPWIFTGLLALGVGVRMMTGRFYEDDKDVKDVKDVKDKGKDGPA